MNVSATTFVANTGKVGKTTTERVNNINNGQITTIKVSGDTTITGNAFVKTVLTGSVIDDINNTSTDLNTRILGNITKISSLETRQASNNNDLSGISAEYHSILQNEFPTTDKVADLSGRCDVNENTILDVSNEIYLLETANEGGYPLDAEQTALEDRNNRNISDSDILFIRVYGLKDDALDGNFADRSFADGIESRINVNTQNIADASEGYYYVFNNVSTLATQENYDDLSERTIDTSNVIAPYIGDTNLFGFNDVSNREGDLSSSIGYLGDLSDSYSLKITALNHRINDISNQVSVTNERVMIGVSADQFIGDASGVIIGEEDTRNNTYFNAKVTDIRGATTISGTAENIIQPNHKLDTDYINTPKDVSSIIVDFTSNTPYVPTHHIILDPSESAVLGDGAIMEQSDSGIGLDIRISRLSKSRRIVVTVPPACASRMTLTLYDDDTFTTISNGYGISDERTTQMQTNMEKFYNILKKDDPLSNANTYKIRDSIQISPACAPAIDVSFLELNLTQKLTLVTQLLNDTQSVIDPNGTPRLQYPFNPMNTNIQTNKGGSCYHIVRNVARDMFGIISEAQYAYLDNVSSMDANYAITETNNVKLHGLPSFLLNQTIDRVSNGNRFDIIFGGASRFVHPTNNTNTEPAGGEVGGLPGDELGGAAGAEEGVSLVGEGEIASPFDYYGGNSYTFEINLVSTGRPEHKDLVKLYITEKTRQAPSRRYYTNKFVNNVVNIVDEFGQALDGQAISVRFTDYKEENKGNIYSQLTPNPPVV